MLTSAPGRFKPIPVLPQKQAGFSLLEMLIVLVVLSVAASMIVIRGTPGDSRYLEAQAQKLSQILRIAQQEALLKSTEIRFVALNKGFEFETFDGLRWQPMTNNNLLRPRKWDSPPIEARLYTAGQLANFLTISPTPGLINKEIQLQKNDTVILLNSQTGGHFVVSRPKKLIRQGGRS